MKKLRVIQWTTGKVGKHSLRAILDDPRLQLVGVYAHSSDKVGRDAGQLCERANTGILATADMAELLALDADCVLYTAQLPEVDMLTKLLESGLDVVSTTTFGRSGGMDASIRQQLETACAHGGSSIYMTGVSPGWINSIAVALTAPVRAVTRIHISESANVSNYASRETWLAHGMSMPAVTADIVANTQRSLLPFRETIQYMADALYIQLDEVRFQAAHATAARAVDLGWIKIERNAIAAVRSTWSGVSRGREVLAMSIAWRLSDELNEDWPRQTQHYHLRIDGVPNVDTNIDFVPPADWHPSDFSILTALPAVNAIPACATPWTERCR